MARPVHNGYWSFLVGSLSGTASFVAFKRTHLAFNEAEMWLFDVQPSQDVNSVLLVDVSRRRDII